MTYSLVFAPGTADETTLDSGDITNLTPKKVHTGKGKLRGTLTPTSVDNRDLDKFAQRKSRVNFVADGETVWTGYIYNVSHDKRGATSTFQADGIAKRLEETRPDYESLGGNVTYSNTSVTEAIRDYWGRTEFSNFTVYEQDTEVIAENQEVHEANTTAEFQDLFSTTVDVATTPIVAEGDTFHPAQSSWTTDDENLTEINTPGITNDPKYAGGSALQLNSTGQGLEIQFTPVYDVPGEDAEFWMRIDSLDLGPELTITVDIDGSSQSWSPVSDQAGLGALGWNEFFRQTYGGSGSYDDSDWPAGSTVTITVEATTDGDGHNIDIFSPLDSRFTYTFDNDNGDDGSYLEGPEHYPQSVEAIADTVGVSFNMVHSDVTSSIDDTSGIQRISVSNDAGDTYTNFDNTTTVSHDYTDAGREAKLKVRLGRYGSRTGETPTTGFNAQTISSITHEIDGNDLTVIDQIELSRNHFNNLQTLHNFGDYVGVIQHSAADIENLVVESFTKGSQTKPAPDGFDLQENKTTEVQAKTYYNTIYLEGRLVNGSRPSFEADDQDAINEDGRVISPGGLRDLNISTEAGAIFRARAILEKALDKSAVRGTVDAGLAFPHPGYAYPVDFNDDGTTETYTAEQVNINVSTSNVGTTYDFVNRAVGLSDEIQDLKQNGQETGDQV